MVYLPSRSDPAAGGDARQVHGQQFGEQPVHRRCDDDAGDRSLSRSGAGCRHHAACPRSPRRPRTASAKHSAQLRMKPMVVINAALSSHASRNPGQRTPNRRCAAPEGSSMCAIATGAHFPDAASHRSMVSSCHAHDPGQEVRGPHRRSPRRTGIAAAPYASTAATINAPMPMANWPRTMIGRSCVRLRRGVHDVVLVKTNHPGTRALPG